MNESTTAETSCSETASELHRFLDHELTDESRARVQTHLDNCPGCLKGFEFESDLRAVVANKLQSELPPGLADRIRAAINADS